MRIWTRKSALIQPRTSLGQGDVSWRLSSRQERLREARDGRGVLRGGPQTTGLLPETLQALVDSFAMPWEEVRLSSAATSGGAT